MLYGTGDYKYELIEKWANIPEGWPFSDVSGLSIDLQDRLYVLNRGSHPVIVFDSQGNVVRSWGDGYFSRAHGTCIGPDNSVYCTDDGNHIVSKFTPEGELLLTLGNKDQPSDTGYEKKSNLFHALITITRGGPPFNRPTGVALSSSGEIFISDGYGNARVHKFSKDGELIFSWGEPGAAAGQFILPHSVWVDKEDRVWITDRENSRIQIFNDNGEFINQWTDLGRPTDIFMDNEGVIYVSELSPPRISIFTPEGHLLARWGNEMQKNREDALFFAPHDIAVDSKGDIYIGEVSLAGFGIDLGAKSIHKFVRRR